MKYIMLEVGDLPKKVPIIFPESEVHAQVAAAIVAMYRVMGCEARVVSAGYIGQNWECYGKSTSLKMKAHPEDTGIVRIGDAGACMWGQR